MKQNLSDVPTSASLWSIDDWAHNWRHSERKCQLLRRHPLFPPDATVYLGVRCVRFRVDRLIAFAAALASATQQCEPARLRRGREARKAAQTSAE